MAMHQVEIEHSMLMDMVRNNKYQFAATNTEISSMKVVRGDILLMDIKNYDTYFDEHPVNVFIDGFGNEVVCMKKIVFTVESIIPIPGTDQSIINMSITKELSLDMPTPPEMKKPAGLPMDYL